MLGATAAVIATIAMASPFARTDLAPAPSPRHPAAVQDTAVVTSNPTLQASLDRIASQSALWREALASLRGTNRRIRVVASDQVLVADARGGVKSFDREVLAQVAPVRAEGSTRVNLVIVVINLELLQRMYFTATAVPADLHADIDRVVIHEVYGHALPYVLAGDMSGRCADPTPDERPSEACSIKRENEIRAELRLGRRMDRGFEGLTLTRRSSLF
jgi:hypothetical protein